LVLVAKTSLSGALTSGRRALATSERNGQRISSGKLARTLRKSALALEGAERGLPLWVSTITGIVRRQVISER